ncbi:MAG: hypothetical protein J0H34_18680 [Rhizobiales bacterium]|nr:hypothetical protein [Hyphomicrobiales bacterium]
MTEEEPGTISIGDILGRLWRLRGLVIALPVLGLLLGLTITAWVSFAAPRPLIYYISLNTIENSRYPNGATFQPGDIVSRPVLDNLRSRLKLPQDIDLAKNILAVHDNPVAAGVERLYRDRLAAKNLTQADIEALNTAFGQQLAATVGSTIRLDIDYDAMGLSKSKGVEIALALPAAWTEVYTQQFRTLVSQSLAASIPKVPVEAFRSTTGVLSIDANLAEINRGLTAISNDNRLSSVQDKQGATAQDILQRLELYRDVYSTPIFASYVGNDSVVSHIYLRDQQLRIDQLNEQISNIDESIRKLQMFQTSWTHTEPAQSSGQGAPSTGIQVDASALSQIVGLAEKASNAEYLKELLNKRQDAGAQISSIKRRLEIARPAIDAQEITQDFVQQSYEGYLTLTEAYNQLLEAARARAEDRSGALYRSLTSPRTAGGLIDIRYLVLTAFLALLGFFLAAAYAIFFSPGGMTARREEVRA